MSSDPRLWTFRLRHIIEAAEECLEFVEGIPFDIRRRNAEMGFSLYVPGAKPC
jgi:hypothetical protein